MSGPKDYTYILEEVAIRTNSTVEKVRLELEGLIRAFTEHEDADVRAQWAKIPHKDEILTPEEMIAYFDEQIRNLNHPHG